MERKQRPLQVARPVLGQILTGIREARPYFESKDAAKAYLEGRVTERRNGFIAEYREKVHGIHLLTYEPALDREVYKELNKHKHIHEDAYLEVLKGLNSYTRFQVETFIGERLNVGLSKFRFDLDFSEGTGVLHGQGMKEPLLEMIARGRDCRNEVAGDVDLPRQVAEVTQFEKIQEVMGNPETAFGTTVVSFSPPGKEGSAYAHNFYDVFTLKEDDKGERYVEARRYASDLSLDDSLRKAEVLQSGITQELKPDEEHVDAFLLSHPLVIEKGHEFFDKPDAIHKFLQGDKKAMSYEDFQKKVVQDTIFSEMVTHYLRTLEDDPKNKHMLDMTLNALMNRADEIVDMPKALPQRRGMLIKHADPAVPLSIMAHIHNYGVQEVRQTATGCGSSGGFGQGDSRFSSYGSSRLPSNMSPTKSSEVASGEDKYGKQSFDCPSCGFTNTRPYNELIPECQNPGECSNRKAVAC